MGTIEQVGLAETVKIGPDLVTVGGDRLVIDAKHAMPEWQVREFSPMPIYFRDKKYLLRQKLAGEKPYAVRYILGPWPEGTSQGNRTFNYDAEAVAQREGALRDGHVDDAGRAFLIFLYPFLGLLWSNTKEKLRRFGFDPRGTTGISIFLVFGLVLLELVFAKMLIFRTLKSGEMTIGGMLRAFTGKDYLSIGPFDISMMWLDITLFAFLILDVLIRYSQHLKEEEPFWGFLEWLMPRKKVRMAAPPKAEPIRVEKAREEEVRVPIKMSK